MKGEQVTLAHEPHIAGPVCDRYEHHTHLIDGSIRTGAQHQPGDPHEYKIKCAICGRPGTLKVSVTPEVEE